MCTDIFDPYSCNASCPFFPRIITADTPTFHPPWEFHYPIISRCEVDEIVIVLCCYCFYVMFFNAVDRILD